MNALAKDNELLGNIKDALPRLSALLDEMSSSWEYEDPVYRFYYGSWKVYGLQEETKRIIEALRAVAPEGTSFCQYFEEICQAGAGGTKFEDDHNEQWTAHTRVFLEAFFHARFFLEMAVKYGKELETAPTLLPSGWAALLCLYDMR